METWSAYPSRPRNLVSRPSVRGLQGILLPTPAPPTAPNEQEEVVMLRAIHLLAPLTVLVAAGTASAQGRLLYQEFYAEPHQLMKNGADSWIETQRLRSGYYDYELADGRYPGRIYYTPPGRGVVPWRVVDWLGERRRSRSLVSGTQGEHFRPSYTLTPWRDEPLRPAMPTTNNPGAPPSESGSGYGLRTGR